MDAVHVAVCRKHSRNGAPRSGEGTTRSLRARLCAGRMMSEAGQVPNGISSRPQVARSGGMRHSGTMRFSWWPIWASLRPGHAAVVMAPMLSGRCCRCRSASEASQLEANTAVRRLRTRRATSVPRTVDCPACRCAPGGDGDPSRQRRQFRAAIQVQAFQEAEAQSLNSKAMEAGSGRRFRPFITASSRSAPGRCDSSRPAR